MTVCLDKVAYFTLEQTPKKKRAVHDVLFGRELLQRNMLIKMKILTLTLF